MNILDEFSIIKGIKVILILCLLIFASFGGEVFSQNLDKYKFNENHELELVVHIMGEVKKPGEYTVSDKTDVAELLAKAGGPTEFSNLKSVFITRVEQSMDNIDGQQQFKIKKSVIKVNLDGYLKHQKIVEVPKLVPGDIVLIPRNSWHKWRHVFTIVRDVSVVASAYFLYLRATKK